MGVWRSARARSRHAAKRSKICSFEHVPAATTHVGCVRCDDFVCRSFVLTVRVTTDERRATCVASGRSGPGACEGSTCVGRTASDSLAAAAGRNPNRNRNRASLAGRRAALHVPSHAYSRRRDTRVRTQTACQTMCQTRDGLFQPMISTPTLHTYFIEINT